MQSTGTEHVAETRTSGLVHFSQLNLRVVLEQHSRQLLVRNRCGRVNLVAAGERLSNLAVTSPVQGVRGRAACRIREGCNLRVFAHASVTGSVVQQSNKLLTGHGAVRLKHASLRVRHQPLLLVRHADILSERVVIRNILERSLQDLSLSHRDARSNLVGNLLTPRVGANIQLQGVLDTLTLHQLDGELVATAEAVSVTVKFGGERPGAQSFERVVTNVAVAYGQGGVFGEEFAQTVCSVVDGHTGFGDGGTLNDEARAFSFLGCRGNVGGCFICLSGLCLQGQCACSGGGSTLYEESS